MSIAHGIQARHESPLAQLERDQESFLPDTHDWHHDLTEAFAHEDDLVMLSGRPKVSEFIRRYLEKNLSVPEARVLRKNLQNVRGKDQAPRRHRYQLFPRVDGQQACKIAGMRKSRKPMPDV